jgi:hypothetical protein
MPLLALFSNRGVQMIIDVCRFLSNENRSSVNVFIVTKNNSVAEASTWMMKYFNEASVLYIFLTLDIKGINDIRLISRPIHAPNHELEDTDTNTPPTKVISMRIFVELLGIREESFIVYLWGMNPLTLLSLLFYFDIFFFITWCMVHGGV